MRPLSLLLLMMLFAECSKDKKPVSYQTDIQPVITTHCIQCHGDAKAYRKIKMTTYDEVINAKIRSTGTPIVIPGQVTKSWLYILASTKQEHFRMPPDTSGMQPFTEEEIKLLARWIEEGAQNN